MLNYEFKNATDERKQEMLSEVISKYTIKHRDEMIQALGHAQALLDCTQDEFANHPDVSISTRMLRNYKKDYLDLYTASFERYSAITPELKDVNGLVDEDVMEQVYENLLSRLKSPKTSTKDIVALTEYFGITKDEFRKYTDFRNATLRGFMSDNLSQVIQDEDAKLLIKSLIAESPYLYQGTERTLGNTVNALKIDMDNPLARLEVQTLGLLFMSLFNGKVTDAFNNHAQALRLLKLASDVKSSKEMQKSHNEFELMDGKAPVRKPVTEKFLIDTFGVEEGKEMYKMLNKVEKKADTSTVTPMPKYEDVEEDYLMHLKVFPEMDTMPVKVMVAKLQAQDDKLKERYSRYLAVNED